MVTRLGTYEKPLQGPVLVRNKKSGEKYFYEPAWKKSEYYAPNVMSISALPGNIKEIEIQDEYGKFWNDVVVYGGNNRRHISITLPSPEKLKKRSVVFIDLELTDGTCMKFQAYFAPASKQKIAFCSRLVEPILPDGLIVDYGWDQEEEDDETIA